MINKVILMGRLVADPELRQTSIGVSVCRFRIAINRQFVSKETGERQSDFINIVAWRQQADFVAKYFTKGRLIIVEGALRNNDYTDQNGVKHYSMEVHADNVTFGESKSASAGNNNFGGYGNQGGQPQFNGNAYQQPQNGSYQQFQNNQYQQTPAPQLQQSVPNESLQIGDLSDFEVLSDGDVPF